MGYPALDLKNKTAVVIGGTSGIGLTLAKGLAQAGANVVPTGRRTDLVESAAEQVRVQGRKSLVMPADVTDKSSLETLLSATIREFGSVQILVNCAGRTKRTPTLDVSEDEWDCILKTNLNGTLYACQVFGRHMIEQKYGRIINIASLSSFVALYEVAAYSASKSAVASLTQSLAIEWARHGVCVNALAPGYFATELNDDFFESEHGKALVKRIPQRRLGQLSELDGPLLLLISNAGSFMTGSVVTVDGGHLVSGL